jgi:hypothetical protein
MGMARPTLRRFSDQSHRTCDLEYKTRGYRLDAREVPIDGGQEFARGFLVKLNAFCGCWSAEEARDWTSFQGIALAFPESNAAARREISSCHRASASGSGEASRLFKSEAARSARSSSVRDSACWRSLTERSVIAKVYASRAKNPTPDGMCLETRHHRKTATPL